MQPVEQNFDLIVDEAARGGAVDVPQSGCSTECQQVWQAERAGTATDEAWFLRMARDYRIRARLFPALRELGTISLAYGSFELGWLVGTGIRTKILKIGLPEPSAPKVGAQEGTLWFRPQGASIARNDQLMPVDGWLYTYNYNSQTWASVNVRFGWDHPCAYLTAAPAGLRVLPGQAAYWCDTIAPVESYYLEEEELKQAAPIEDYVAQPYDRSTSAWAGVPDSRSSLEATVRDALASNPYYEDLACSLVDPQACPSPQRQSSREKCELEPGGMGFDPAQSRGTGDWPSQPTEFTARYDTVPPEAFLPFGGTLAVWPESGIAATVAPPGQGPVYMRYGYARQENNPGEAFSGWGFRKIVAKHGWTAADRLATEEALRTDLDPDPDYVRNLGGSPGSTIRRFVYRGPIYSLNGVDCERVVVVDYDRHQKEIDAGMPAATLITSYGARATP